MPGCNKCLGLQSKLWTRCSLTAFSSHPVFVTANRVLKTNLSLPECLLNLVLEYHGACEMILVNAIQRLQREHSKQLRPYGLYSLYKPEPGQHDDATHITYEHMQICLDYIFSHSKQHFPVWIRDIQTILHQIDNWATCRSYNWQLLTYPWVTPDICKVSIGSVIAVAIGLGNPYSCGDITNYNQVQFPLSLQFQPHADYHLFQMRRLHGSQFGDCVIRYATPEDLPLVQTTLLPPFRSAREIASMKESWILDMDFFEVLKQPTTDWPCVLQFLDLVLQHTQNHDVRTKINKILKTKCQRCKLVYCNKITYFLVLSYNISLDEEILHLNTDIHQTAETNFCEPKQRLYMVLHGATVVGWLSCKEIDDFSPYYLHIFDAHQLHGFGRIAMYLIERAMIGRSICLQIHNFGCTGFFRTLGFEFDFNADVPHATKIVSQEPCPPLSPKTTPRKRQRHDD